MDMDSSRRPFDRSREPGFKKPRLTDELERGSSSSLRPFPQRQVASGVNSLAQTRFRTNDRDSESSESGRGGYQPQPLHQELVNQYKTALAELTFNSKPIITNLTIIAGENLYAAKAVAATVCANILEVPTEQKLPSLYLLDSIVKNIGRDYIKYFAARLPEVFCKAYRQVDSSVHSSMRHLFGTWKGVFPLQTLQMIEKELGFTPAVNGSSSASALRSDSQSQRPQHSIHVNPKYLERQRLQQSGRIKGTNDIAGTITNSSDGAERPDRALGAARPWMDSSANMHNIQGSNRDSYNDSVSEKGIGASYGGSGYGSDLSRNSGLGIGRTGGRTSELAHDKAWYKDGSNAADMMSVQRNGFTLKRGLSNHEAPKSINMDEHNQPTQSLTSIKSSVLSSSWKNSEEEEYMWDEVNAGLTEHGASNVSNNLSKDCWTADDDNLSQAVDGHLQSTFHEDRDVSTEMKRLPAFGNRPSLSWKSQQQQPFDELNHRPCSSEGVGSTLGRLPNIVNSSNVKTGNRPFLSNSTLGSVGTVQQQQFHSMGAESPSLQSPLRQQSPSPPVNVHHPHQMRILSEQDHSQTLKMSQFSGRLRSQDIRDSSSVLPHTVQVGNSQRSHQKNLQDPLPSVSTFQPRHHNVASLPQHLGSNTEVSQMKEKMIHSKETLEQSSTSTMLAAVMKSGIFTSGQPGTSFLDRGNLPSKSGVQPTGPSGSSPTTSVSSGPGVASPSRLGPSNDDTSSLPKESRGKVGAPTRLPALPPASSTLSSASAKNSNATNNKSNPVSNLLNSLVAKGLISAKIHSSTEVPAEVLNRLEDQSQSITTSSTLPSVSVTDSATVPVLSTEDDQPAKGSSSQSTPTEIKNLIGFEFKPSLIRELHLPVIGELLDNFPHHCSICGLRLKHQEQFKRHLEWHAMRERTQSDVLKASRRWYLRSSDWVVGKDEVSSEFEGIDPIDSRGNKSDVSEEDAKVPSDEDQCLCLLCGELFEDFYCQERDEWMFKGAVYLPVSSSDSEMYVNVGSKRGPIVHTWCLSESSISSAPTKEQG